MQPMVVTRPLRSVLDGWLRWPMLGPHVHQSGGETAAPACHTSGGCSARSRGSVHHALLLGDLLSPPAQRRRAYHLNSIWCGHGVDADTCRSSGAEDVRIVPHQLTSSACFTQNSALGAVCRADDVDDALTPDAPSTIGNWSGHAYPRLYYFAMSAFVGDSLDASVLTIRVVNSLVAVLLVAALALLLPRRLRSVAPLAFLVTAVPLSLFTLASANPSSWATISAGTTWLAVYGAYETRGRQQAALLALGVVAAVMGPVHGRTPRCSP